jgi:ArsR family transcriptional regulator
MAQSKSEQFDPDMVQLAEFAGALAHPARLEILKKLATTNSCICGDIVQLLPLAQSTVSQHLKALKEAGLVDGEVEGPRTCYCLNLKACEKMISLVNSFIQKIRKKEDDESCC